MKPAKRKIDLKSFDYNKMQLKVKTLNIKSIKLNALITKIQWLDTYKVRANFDIAKHIAQDIFNEIIKRL